MTDVRVFDTSVTVNNVHWKQQHLPFRDPDTNPTCLPSAETTVNVIIYCTLICGPDNASRGSNYIWCLARITIYFRCNRERAVFSTVMHRENISKWIIHTYPVLVHFQTPPLIRHYSTVDRWKTVHCLNTSNITFQRRVTSYELRAWVLLYLACFFLSQCIKIRDWTVSIRVLYDCIDKISRLGYLLRAHAELFMSVRSH